LIAHYEARVCKAVAIYIATDSRSLNAEVKKYAASALGDMKSEKAIDPLIQVLPLNKDYWKNFVDIDYIGTGPVFALAHIGDPAVLPLTDALKNEDPDIRTGAAFALGKIGDERAKESLTRALNDKNQKVQWYAKRALQRLDSK